VSASSVDIAHRALRQATDSIEAWRSALRFQLPDVHENDQDRARALASLTRAVHDLEVLRAQLEKKEAG